MVKGYDPTVNDPSKIVLEYLMRWSTTPNPLSLEQAEKYTKYWLRNSQSTSKIYNMFSAIGSQNSKRPQILLKKNCSKALSWSYLKILMPSSVSSDQNYPAYTQNNKIVVCLNQITNKTELKQNIDRQLMILLKKQQKQASKQSLPNSQNLATDTQIEQRDKQLMQFIYEGCRQGYKNYMMEKQAEQRLTKKCAKYLFFRRCKRQLPYDAKFRYTSKIIEEVI